VIDPDNLAGNQASTPLDDRAASRSAGRGNWKLDVEPRRILERRERW
jgi:hypothetical protein